MAEQAANRKGDLLTDRMKDLFHALGYDIVATNLHKSGRELDLIGRHRLENRKLIAECKAHAEPIGGADINKFVGALDAEREAAVQLSGYFVSTSGFKDSALEQERALNRQRCVLMGPQEITDQLIAANVMRPTGNAVLAVGALVDASGLTVQQDYDVVLHESGWLSLLRLTDDCGVKGIAVAYASGRLLTKEAAQGVIDSIGDQFEYAGALLLAAPSPKDNSNLDSAKEAYFSYLTREYGVIRQEGMPTDAEFGGSKPVPLEELYVPQRLQPKAAPAFRGAEELSIPWSDEVGTLDQDTVDLSEALDQSEHLCILGPPGAGKSTLIRRLAVAYASRDRLEAVEDALPDRDWVPIVVRCRELPNQWSAFSDVIAHLTTIAEMPSLSKSFLEWVDEVSDTGKLLLLVDGMDEIADQAERLRFSAALRTFLGRHPATRLLVTSREAGFRLVAGAMAEFAEEYRLVEMSEDDIRTLTASWCAHVYGTTQADKERADAIAQTIVQDWRLRRLVSTPLLLVMLLVVQRWSGGQELPKKRSLLYRRAVEVLLNTWNVEGHQPLDLDEALPQLGYVAHEMTLRGEQRISLPVLQRTVMEARIAMPDVLGYTATNPTAFVSAVEARSSLLMQAGHAEEHGQTYPAYEFRHRMFQEYLTALALAEGWCPGELETPLAERLRDVLADQAWSEVIALLSVIAGRRGVNLVMALHQQLLDEPADSDESYERIRNLSDTLRDCIVDDAHLTPDLADEVLDSLCWFLHDVFDFVGILESRYGDQFRQVVASGLRGARREYFAEPATYLLLADHGASYEAFVHELERLFASGEEADHVVALTGLVIVSYHGSTSGPAENTLLPLVDAVQDIVERFMPTVLKLAERDRDTWVERQASWALAWMFEHTPASLYDLKKLRRRLAKRLLSSEANATRHRAGWVLARTVIERASVDLGLSGPQLATLRMCVEPLLSEEGPSERLSNEQMGYLVVAYYAGIIDVEQARARAGAERNSWRAEIFTGLDSLGS